MYIAGTDVCTGCGACAALCPVGCIEMKEDKIGHFYPFIHKEKCLGCDLCRKSCPVMNKPKAYPTGKAYACWSLDGEDRKSSTSGGFASVASAIIIEEGGVVYGSALTPDGIKHIRVSDRENLKKLKGSKYVQSPIDEIYKPLSEDMKNGLKVLFVGTPCQTAGVKAYLGKEYDNLLLIDLICTGVPPQKLLWEHLGCKSAMPQEISFRDGFGGRLTIRSNGSAIYQKFDYEDYFFMGFREHLYFRESCYQCPFTGLSRCSDMTIGDFWGLGKKEPFLYDTKDGVSLVMPHNKKGEDLIEKCRDRLFMEERKLDEAIDSNLRYIKPPAKHKNSESFRKYYINNGFKYALKKSLKKERRIYFLRRRKRFLKRFVRKFLKEREK